MDYWKTSIKASIILLLLAGIAAAGCISGSGSANPSPKIVAVVGTPTPIPTEPPEPTVGPTWTPTPTPVPPELSLTEFTLSVKINGDQKEWTQDPSSQQPVNAQYAMRQDTAYFVITNTGGADRKNLKIIYSVDYPMTTIVNGQSYSTMSHQSAPAYDIGTLNRDDYREVSIQSPMYPALLTANMTITAQWDGGSLDLYAARLEPNFENGASYTPKNDVAVKKFGSAS